MAKFNEIELLKVMYNLIIHGLFVLQGFMNVEALEILDLDIISYEKLIQEDLSALETLNKALHEKGIVGVRGVPGYKEKYKEFIEAAKAFSTLPEEIKEQYKPNREKGETFGYEIGKEKFLRPNGKWVVDDLKSSYYALIPDNPKNKWPRELDLKTSFQALGQSMEKMGEQVMYKIGLLGNDTGLFLEPYACLGRMLYYRKKETNENPYWCGAHFDHGLFTVILPSIYFENGKQIPEPEEAGLFVRISNEFPFKKVLADEEVMMFQVGEFGQLVKNDSIKATEHCVKKALGSVERYTFVVFYNAPMDTPIYSTSILTQDERYGINECCTYRHWHEASLQRYFVEK